MKTPHVDILSEKYSEKSESIRRRRDMLNPPKMGTKVIFSRAVIGQ